MEMVSDDTFIQTLQRNGGNKFTSVRREYLVKELWPSPPSRVLGKSSDVVASPPPYDGKSAVISIHMQIGFIIIAGVALTVLVLLILKKC
jgi:hypothetical protein